MILSVGGSELGIISKRLMATPTPSQMAKIPAGDGRLPLFDVSMMTLSPDAIVGYMLSPRASIM